MRSSELLYIVTMFTLALGGCDNVGNSVTDEPSALHSISFNDHVRPILNKNCTGCHGGVTRQGGISYIFRKEALGRGNSGRRNVVPGRPNASELIARITSTDPAVRMPYKGPPLKQQEIEILTKWIKAGAEWDDHWAFVAPQKVPVPSIENDAWSRSPIDKLVLTKLAEEGLKPSLQADKIQLLRRASLDLTGLPPTIEELDSFLNDLSNNAFEQQIDRLLASPHFGERWASVWMDLARYSDSKGYEKDRNRPSWPYRDWVIKAINQNMPYDEFVKTQLAGDLLDAPSVDDVIATAFHRMTQTNDEGGTDDEEFRLLAVMDRSVTTWSALTGMTMNCVQCHSHPYDPIRMEEYYHALSFFNTTNDADFSDDAPTLKIAHEPNQRTKVFNLQSERQELLTKILNFTRKLADKDQWQVSPVKQAELSELAGYQMWERLNVLEALTGRTGTGKRRGLVTPNKLEALKEKISPVVQRVERENAAPLPLNVEAGELNEPDKILPDRWITSLQIDVTAEKISAIRFNTEPLSAESASHTPELGHGIDMLKAYVQHADGQLTPLEFTVFLPDTHTSLDLTLKRRSVAQLQSEIQANLDAIIPISPLNENEKIGFANGLWAHRLFGPRWSVGVLKTPLQMKEGDQLFVELTNTQIAGRVAAVPSHLRRLRIQTSSNESWQELAQSQNLTHALEREALLRQEIEQTKGVFLPIMDEQDTVEMRKTALFNRGDIFAKVGPALEPDTPSIFPEFPENFPRNRLGMAQWFFLPDQPLTARVTINRFWAQLFGTGIVETQGDFGSIGASPSHPELLDWLALRFQDHHKWDVKAMLREIVLSATYQQSAVVSPELWEKDQSNRLLARGPRQRLTAEMVRDQALTASGLLQRAIGGPSVMPPQPDGLWKSGRNEGRQNWETAKDENRYRRAVYTFHKRSAPYPSHITFDGGERAISQSQRMPTNTPLQALVTLNDPVYHEAAQALGQRMKTTGNMADAFNLGARSVISRQLRSREQAVLENLFHSIENDSPPTQTDEAWTAVASALLNLDSAMVR